LKYCQPSSLRMRDARLNIRVLDVCLRPSDLAQLLEVDHSQIHYLNSSDFHLGFNASRKFKGI
jgi:hypothetical protein